MNKLMMTYPLMGEAGGEGGGGDPAEPTPAPAKDGGGGDPAPAKAGEPAPDPAAKAAGVQDVPFLGKPKECGDPAPAKDGEKKPGEQKAEPAKEEDYLKAMAKDEALLGSDKGLVLDESLYRAMIPKAQELGVSPDALNKMANAMAKAQVERARERMRDRVAYFTKMKDESMQRYSQKDFEQINSGIDKWFRPGGAMNHVIRNSELGADPEFLALMHHLGAHVKGDGLAGAGSGAGAGTGDGNGIDGLAKLW